MVINSLAKLLEPCAPEEFLASIWGKNYMHVRGGAGKFAYLMPWERLNEILRQHRLDFPRVRLAQDGQTLPASSYLRYVAGKTGRAPLPRLKLVEMTKHLRQGATLVLDAVNELHAPLEELAAMLELRFRESVQVNAYAGWQTSRGFDLHWDDHDVYVLQVTGRKRWSIYGMTRPSPFTGDTQENPKPSGAPLWEETLEDGDLLYIPRGWWHVAQPLNEPTLHLTVGLHNRTGLDLLRWLTQRMSASEIFRQDLPRFASETERAAHLERMREELFAEWNGDPLKSYFDDLDQRAEPRARLSLPWSPTAEILPPASDTLVRLHAARPLDFKIEDGVVEFSCLKNRWRFAGSTLPILRLLDEKRVCAVSELYASVEAQLDEQTVRTFLCELLMQGLIVVVRD